VSSQVNAVFNERREHGLLIGYLPLGFPTVDASVEAAVALVENGVDILEMGLPYSDPVMDGLVIQRATNTALEAGFRLSHTFDAVAAIRERVDAPVLVMTYFNPILQYGVDAFARDLAAAGGAGLITPDLIPDEAKEWLGAADAHDLDHVFLAAPSSSADRLSSATSNSRGFVYAVSTMGITGARNDVDTAARGVVARLRESGATNIGVGLGISTPEQVREVLDYADAAIVGSALVSALAEGGPQAAGALAKKLSAGKH
jgi:tryptophan synthase alpha chain